MKERGVAVLGIATSTMHPRMTPERTRVFAERFGLTMPLAMEPGEEVYRAYGSFVRDASGAPFPRQYVVDADGSVVHASGRYDSAALEAVLGP